MNGKFRIKDSDKCVHCRICRENCSFLSKYGLDIGDTAELKELAYHCFLCGTCTQVCPLGIDGRAVILDMRRERVEETRENVRKKGTPWFWRKSGIIFTAINGVWQAGAFCFRGAIFLPFIQRPPGN